MSEFEKNRQEELELEKKDRGAELDLDEGSTIFGKKEPDKPAGYTKKKNRSLILGVIALLLLAGTMVAVVLLFPKQDTAGTSSTDASLQLTSVQEMTKLSITNEKGSLTLTAQAAEPSDSSAPAQESAENPSEQQASAVRYTVAPWDDTLPLDQSGLSSLADAVKSLTATRRMEADNQKNADYGLSSPSLTAVLTAADGEITVSFGSASPDGSGYYAAVSGKDGIYLIATGVYDQLNIGAQDLVDKTITAKLEAQGEQDSYFDSTGALNKFDSITLSGSCRSQAIELGTNEKTTSGGLYLITAPVSRYASASAADLLSPLTSGLTAASVYAVHPDAQTLEKYGLSDPVSVIRYIIKGESITLKIGIADDTNYAVMLEGRPVIYQLAQSSLSFAQIQAKELYSPALVHTGGGDVTAAVFEADGATATFDISRTENEDGTVTTTVKLNGTELDTEQWNAYYQRLSAISAQDLTDDPPPATDPVATLTLRDDSDNSDVYTFYADTSRRIFAAQNGQGRMVILSDTLDDIKQATQDLMSGTPISAQ